jgi:replicative DNA helicase
MDEEVREFVPASELVGRRVQELRDLQARQARGEKVWTGTPTGFRKFDEDTGGLPPALCVLAAGTGVGKSSFARSFAWGAIRSGLGEVILGNFEDGNRSFADRVLGEKTGFGATRIRKLDFLASDLERLEAVANDPLLKHIHVTDNLYEVDDFCKRVVARHRKGKIALVIGDYLQIMQVRGVSDPHMRVMTVADRLAKLAKYIQAPVLALSQLAQKKIEDRGAEQFYKAKQAGVTGDDLYEGFAPMLGDLQWASEISQYGKMILGVHRPGPHRRSMENKPDRDTKAQIRMLKANDFECQRYETGWNGKLTQAYDIS